MKLKTRVFTLTYGLLSAFAAIILMPASSGAGVELSRGQTLYAPAYSHVYIGDKGAPFNLAATLSVRNTDPSNSIILISADYYDSNGKFVRRMMLKPVTLKPLASTSFFVKERDTSGGFGASFIVKWRAEKDVCVPLVETIMIGSYSGQGISFISPAIEIR